MADEEKEQESRKGGKKEEPAEGGEKPKRRLPLKLIAIVGLGVALVGGGIFFAWRHFGGAEEKKEAAPVAEAAAEAGQNYKLEQFIVNLVDPLGRRYLKLQLELEMDNPAAVEEAGKRNAQLRDSVITLLTSKTYSDIDSPEGKLQLRQEIIARANQFLHSGKAVNAYFTDFVVQ